MMQIDQARRLVASALEKSVEEVAADGALGAVPGWDSLGHLRIVLSLETMLGRTLGPQEILHVESVEDVAALLAAGTGRPSAF